MALTENQLQNLPTNPDQSVAELGKDSLLYIDGGTNSKPDWKLVGGQRNSPINQSATSIDASHKTSGGWATNLAGIKSWTCAYTGLLIMSDDGLQVLEHCFRNDKQAHVKFVYKDGSYQTGWAAVTQFNKDTNYTSVATVSVTLSGVGAISEVTAAMTTPTTGGESAGGTTSSGKTTGNP